MYIHKSLLIVYYANILTNQKVRINPDYDLITFVNTSQVRIKL